MALPIGYQQVCAVLLSDCLISGIRMDKMAQEKPILPQRHHRRAVDAHRAPHSGLPRRSSPHDRLAGCVIDAIFYLLCTGCQWRYLPKDFPPESTVWRYFDEWRHNGTLDTIHDLLRRKVRAQEKPYSPRTTATVDSESLDTTSGGEERGRDNTKKVDGRKRHIVVDSLGLLLAALVTAASVDEARAAQELFPRLEG
jgi:putative transposase